MPGIEERLAGICRLMYDYKLQHPGTEEKKNYKLHNYIEDLKKSGANEECRWKK